MEHLRMVDSTICDSTISRKMRHGFAIIHLSLNVCKMHLAETKQQLADCIKLDKHSYKNKNKGFMPLDCQT